MKSYSNIEGIIFEGDLKGKSYATIKVLVYEEDAASLSNARILTIDNVVKFADLENRVIYIKANYSTDGTANTISLNINGLGAKLLRHKDGDTFSTDFSTCPIIKEEIYSVVYDGTYYNLTSGGGSGSGSDCVKSSDLSNLDWITMTEEEFEQAKLNGTLPEDCIINVLDEQTIIGKLYLPLAGGTMEGPITGELIGNASTATKLETARKINGVDFDGSADISTGVTSQATTLTCNLPTDLT